MLISSFAVIPAARASARVNLVTDIQDVVVLWEAHGEESRGHSPSFVTWSVTICG